MKTKNIILIIIVIAITLAGLYYSKNSTEINDAENVQPSEQTQNDTFSINDENLGQEKTTFTISNGIAQYSVQKTFFNKPTETITGATSDMTGILTYQDNTLTGNATISTENLTTSNTIRDNEVKQILGENIIVEIQPTSNIFSDIKNIPADVSINNITRTVLFDIQESAHNNLILLKGSAIINMDDFSITPPGIPNVYTVENEVLLTFTLEAY